VNALHVTLQQGFGKKKITPESEATMNKILSKGIKSADSKLVYSLMLDSEFCKKAHSQLWIRPESELADQWCDLITLYATPKRPVFFATIENKDASLQKHLT
jgi:hypothetical protein